MAELEGNMQSRSLFNRSRTLQATAVDQSPKIQPKPSLYRAGSMNKFYNSIESVVSASNSIKGKVKKLCSIFESSKSSKLESNSQLKPIKKPEVNRVPSFTSNGNSIYESTIKLPGTEDRIVVYFTSLRGIRRTYEDCYAVRMIFRGFRVWIDERDISMDYTYKKELQSVLGDINVGLPQVFIRGHYVGGAEVIKRMFEYGELAKILQGFPMIEPGFVCQGCGDARFVPCVKCSGSRKVFDEDEDVIKRCWDCNENGLIRCPDCCS
ncbi:Glutaredoxin domain-containing protein [Cephalotus follicularis]|uniref:Glutaredoxin domain-containing protein n=1 Tax=Cephalotus follicularis TaxID=3775 RepID=A0A1Q3CJB8_CEPFO|nr:Glutaredoxin domain-containing protein [Cephalotus follicularis]